MKNKLFGIGLVALMFLAFGWISLNSQTTQAQSVVSQKWEYKSVDKSWTTVSEDKLNKLGNEGWELVAIQNDPVRFVFKRPKN